MDAVHCRCVFLRGLREDVGAVAFGDKEEVVVLCREEDCSERSSAGVADWCGRESGMKVGVIGRGGFQVVKAQPFFVFRQDVLNRGAGLERDVAAQAIEKDAGNDRKLFRQLRLLFHN